jgi:hypothetical protein
MRIYSHVYAYKVTDASELIDKQRLHVKAIATTCLCVYAHC